VVAVVRLCSRNKLFDNVLIMFDWIRRRHKELEQSKESPSTEAVKKFLDDLDDLSFLDMVPWRLVPWNLEENDFAEFLEKLISHRTRLELEVQLDQLVRELKKSDKERDEHSKVAADTGLSEAERNIAEYKLRLTKRRAERLNDDLSKIISKKQIFDKISDYQGALTILHPTVKAGSLTLAEIESEIERLTTPECVYPGNKPFELTSEMIEKYRKMI
jgi:hypothetical protein